jgi:hypothetical protein
MREDLGEFPGSEPLHNLIRSGNDVIELTMEQAAMLNRVIRARGGEAPPYPPEEVAQGSDESRVVSESPGTVTVEQLFVDYSLPERRFSKLTRDIVEQARVFAIQRGRGHELTSSCILFAIAELGTNSDPSSATHFFRRWINQFAPSGYEKSFADFLRPTGSGQSYENTVLTFNCVSVIETSWKIANSVRKQTGKSLMQTASELGEIYARDLLGAIIYEASLKPGLGAARRLAKMDVSLSNLRNDFLEVLSENLYDDIKKWRSILIDLQPQEEPEPRIPRVRKAALPSIDADTPSLRDDLGITSEVKGFANIIAARDVKTPLSIGLFGDWGSGKSTFMEQLQVAVEEISAGVRAKKDDEETSFLGNIVQIKFNAWHYAEANLWASLVSHVFENLSFSDKEAKQKAEDRKHLILGQLVTNLATQRVAEAEVKAKEANYETARTALDGAQRDVAAKRLDLQDAVLKGVWPLVSEFLQGQPEVRERLQEARTLLGRVNASEEELKREIDASRSTIGRIQLRFSELAKDPHRGLYLAAILVVPLLITIALTALVAQFANTDVLQRVIAGVTPLLTLVGGVVTWWSSKRNSVTTILDTLDDAGRKLDQVYARARARYELEQERLEQEVAERKAEIVAAKQKVQEAQQEREATLVALRQMEPGRELETFVQERAASEDYRKLLGVIALIRRDFKRLSDMLREQGNDELRQAVTEILKKDAEQRELEKQAGKVEENGGAQSAAGESEKVEVVPEIKESEIDERMKEYRIDRIVLYIDDLDRCPPRQVVDVLQAIHLLLAFELFVVVVGVDARWIGHALRKQFPEMLNEDWEERNGGGNGDRQVTQTATPRDYVEKIFQVPFWLKPLDDDASRRLLEGLIPNSQLLPVLGTGHVADSENKTKSGERHDTQSLPKENKTVSPRDSAGEGGSVIPSEITAKEGTSSELNVNTKGAGREAGEAGDRKKPDLVLNPESLLLDVKEREAMVALSRVIGRTPRTLKRFVNIYRIIKAGLNDEQLDAFIGTGPSDAQYKAVLLLLSVAHGAPDVAPAFFRELMRADLTTASDKQPITGLRALLNKLSTREVAGVPRSVDKLWLELTEELVEVMSKDKDDIALEVLREWLPVVVRYTFQLGRLSEEVAAETDDKENRREE